MSFILIKNCIQDKMLLIVKVTLVTHAANPFVSIISIGNNTRVFSVYSTKPIYKNMDNMPYIAGNVRLKMIHTCLDNKPCRINRQDCVSIMISSWSHRFV